MKLEQEHSVDASISAENAEQDAGTNTIAISDVRREPELNCRHAGVSKTTAAGYADSMKAGANFPPIVVFRDSKGIHWLADGWHRCAAAELAGIERLPCDTRSGSRRDALLFAAGANAEHGRARSPSDKRKAVEALLSEPQWAKRADNWIAKHAKVSHTFVAKMRGTCNDSSEGTRETADGRVMDTSNIGKAAAGLDQLVTKFRKLLGTVSDEQRATFSDQILQILSASHE